MTTDRRLVTSSCVLSDPHSVLVVANGNAVRDFGLDEWEGEQYDWLRDIIAITFTGDEVEFVKCRTLRDRRRGSTLVPRKYLDRIEVW